jgi:signal transduction histidine kinase
VSGDFWSLVELFAILLDNAVKYSPEGSAVTVSGGHEKDRRLTVSVSDQGVGIAAADLPHIFDRFYQADRSRSKDHSTGYGLGLSIAQKIVELHQGSIEVSSQLGHGTVFTVTLPAAGKKTQGPA